MDLVNQTAVPAELLVAEMSDEDCRGGLLVAKATFDVVPGSAPQLATQDPLPLFAEPTPLDDVGDLPADVVPREDPGFEVILLGACHGPSGRPTRQQRVSMSVGDVTRHLLVTGDRVWLGEGDQARIGPAVEFTRLPLTYERAFGGTAEILLDPHSTYPVFDQLNPRGRGFDPADYAASCAATFECAPGYPAIVPGPRPLPNLEDPQCVIRAWGDHPEPVCWATIPSDIGFGIRAMHARLKRYGSAPLPAQQATAGYYRAHPDWTFEAPPPGGAGVWLQGVSPNTSLAFSLPLLRVLADYEIGARQGVLELKPHALVILAEKLRFCLTYRAFFRFGAAPTQARSFRLRLAVGWNGTQ